MTAPVPQSQYITLDNVINYIGSDKVLIADNDSTAIPTALANQLVATGESLALLDISPYYQVYPSLQTVDGKSWTNLPTMTYTTLFNMMVIQSALQIIGNFIARNTDDKDGTLSYYQNFYSSEYAKKLNRITDLLPNGSYRYQLIGLKPLTNGINRKPKKYARSGRIGNNNSYVNNQLTNPQQNYSNVFPFGVQD